MNKKTRRTRARTEQKQECEKCEETVESESETERIPVAKVSTEKSSSAGVEVTERPKLRKEVRLNKQNQTFSRKTSI